MATASTNRFQSERDALKTRIFSYDQQIAMQSPQAFRVGSNIWKYITNPKSILNDLMSDPENWLAQEYNGTRYKYTEQEMHDLWHMILVQKLKNENQQKKNIQRIITSLT